VKREGIDVDYLAERMRRRWGFWFTVLKNLQRVATTAQTQPWPLQDADRALELGDRLLGLRGNLRWRSRRPRADHVRWYREVEGEVAERSGIWR
jgi:hypothetical protein